MGEPCTSWSVAKRHYSTNLQDDTHGKDGRRGYALCSTAGNVVEVYDQTYLNQLALTYPGFGKRLIADLDECKRCAKKRQAEEASDG